MLKKLLLTFLSGLLMVTGVCAASANGAAMSPSVFPVFSSTPPKAHKAVETKKEARAEKRIKKVMGKLGSRAWTDTMAALFLLMLLVAAAGVVGMIIGAAMGNFPLVLWSFVAFLGSVILGFIFLVGLMSRVPLC